MPSTIPAGAFDDGEATFIQATNSPVWDTILTLLAFDDAGVAGDYPDAVDKARELGAGPAGAGPGDWSVKLPHVKPGGWAFEYANNYYPDTDDTAVALIALAPLRHEPKWQAKGIDEAIQLGVDWLIGMQSEGGGWGAFDKDNNQEILTKIPFCDFGEALDPPSVDVTAHVVEAFGKLGLSRNHPSMVARARLRPPRAGAGGPVVRPLGRQLCLRHRRGAAGAGGDRRGHEPALYRPRLRLADRAPAGRWRLGRELRLLHGCQRGRPRHRRPHRRPPGR